MLVFPIKIPISQKKVMVPIKTYSHLLLSCPVKTVLHVISYELYSLKRHPLDLAFIVFVFVFHAFLLIKNHTTGVFYLIFFYCNLIGPFFKYSILMGSLLYWQPLLLTITCPNCNITTLASLCQTKLVCQILLQTADNISSFTCFNDALQSFLKSINCQTALSDIEINELKKLLLTAGPQQMIVSKSQRLISQFLKPK